MENNKEIIEKMIDKGVVELTILEGTAPTPPVKFNPLPVLISGAIDSPIRFIEKRYSLIDFDCSHAIAKRGARTITLIINEQSTIDKYTITGSFKESKKFVDLKINTEQGYSPEKLANVLKLQRSIFQQRSDHAGIVSTLRNLKAKINRQIEDSDDKKGNVTKSFEQTVESNMPSGFNLKMPLFEGEPEKEFEVNVTLEADGNGILCYLESVEAAEYMDEIIKQRFDEQVALLQEKLVVIEA